MAHSYIPPGSDWGKTNINHSQKLYCRSRVRIAHLYLAINDIYADFFALFVYCKGRRENSKLIAGINARIIAK